MISVAGGSVEQNLSYAPCPHEVGDAYPKEIVTSCIIVGCPGAYETRDVVHTVRRGDQIVVIDHVPAKVCPVCGDVLFTLETVRRLEALRQTTATSARTVPLYDFVDAVPV